MINPFQVMQTIQNPMGMMTQQMFQTMQSQNPQLAQKVNEMVQGKSSIQMKDIAMNIAKERGIDLNQFANQFGIKL